MAKRETLKEKIERLERENTRMKENLEMYQSWLQEEMNRNAKLSETNGEIISKSPEYQCLVNELDLQKQKAEIYRRRLEYNEKVRFEQAAEIERLRSLAKDLEKK